MQINLGWLAAQFPTLQHLCPLGQGGQKLVLQATHPSHGSVVLKIIHPNQEIEMVRREIRAVLEVQCPRVPQILESGVIQTTLGNCIWLIEKRVVGNTLREVLASRSLQELEVLRLGLHVLEALVKAEEVHIVHRDVKPENIMSDQNGMFWLLDFGLARHLKLDSLTATALPFGKCTPGYAPPEQFRNVKRDIDARADLFGLGITLYEAKSRTNPFRQGARDTLEVFRRTESMSLTRLQFAFGAGANFSDLIDAMTQKRRDHRPVTAKIAFEWIQEICLAEGVS